MLAPSPFLFDEKLALEMLTRNAERQGPLDCEITEGSRANWYLVQTFPNETARAMRWLAKRMFGAFRPMQQQVDRQTGKKLAGWEDVFSGWIFVFAWDIGRMKGRIRRVPGICRIFCDPASKEPVPISDQFVQELRSLQFKHDGTTTNRRHIQAAIRTTTKRKPNRPGKKQRKTLAKLKKALKRKGNWDSSTYEQFKELETHKRIALLQHALMNATRLHAVSQPVSGG
jgi:transcription antitermination factor NusG